MKTVYVILAFHAHEPLWELPAQILRTLPDEELKNTLPGENWLEKRHREGRDIYLGLIKFARTLQIPVTLEITSELLFQIDTTMPATMAEMKKAYREGALYPLYGHAHHTHIALINETEWADEIRLNQEYLHRVLGVPRPRYAGLFPTEDSLDAQKLTALGKAGIDFVIFPNLERRRDRYQVDDDLRLPYEPFAIGRGVIALPRHFPVSQYIWRPITRWKHREVRHQGYLLGHYRVLPEEYRQRRFARFPITREQAIAEYQCVLRRALVEAPDRGVIIYIQDLELMDFGDAALEIMQAAWQAVLKETDARAQFVTPDRYLEEQVMPRRSRLPHLTFHQVSWAPEIRLVLRYDGHYPPLGAGKFRGTDLTRTVFRRWPFIFWEPGQYLSGLCDWLADFAGIPAAIPGNATALRKANYDFSRFETPLKLSLHRRIIKRACNWGWFPNEGLQKRPFLHAYCLADGIIAGWREYRHRTGEIVRPLEMSWLRGLERLLEVILDTRQGFLAAALAKLEVEAGIDCQPAWKELECSRQWRSNAHKAILTAAAYAHRYNTSSAGGKDEALRCLALNVRDYCRAVFLSLDHIQRTWVAAGNTETILTTMYEYLYDLYPPKFPAILQSTTGDTVDPGE